MDDSSQPTGKSRGSAGGWFNILLVAICIALAVLVLLLARQNRNLKQELSAILAARVPPQALAEGDALEPLALLDAGGKRMTLQFGENEPRSLLLVYSTDCPACRETLPIWSSLLESPPPSLRVIGIRLGEGAENVPYLPFESWTPEDAGAALSSQIPFVPATIIVSPTGVVERVWYGQLDDAALDELRGELAGG